MYRFRSHPHLAERAALTVGSPFNGLGRGLFRRLFRQLQHTPPQHIALFPQEIGSASRPVF